MTTIAPKLIILSDGVAIEKTTTLEDILAYAREMAEKRPEEFAVFEKMFEKSVASLETKADEAERVAKEKEAKRLADEEKKATTKAMEKYIMERFSWVMKKGKESYCEGNHSGNLTIAFLRQEEWDAEDFDKVLTNHAEEAEGYLNEAKTGTDFAIHIHLKNDTYHKDGLSKKWLCEFSWEDNYNDAFAEVYARGDAVCDDSDSDDDYE